MSIPKFLKVFNSITEDHGLNELELDFLKSIILADAKYHDIDNINSLDDARTVVSYSVERIIEAIDIVTASDSSIGEYLTETTGFVFDHTNNEKVAEALWKYVEIVNKEEDDE